MAKSAKKSAPARKASRKPGKPAKLPKVQEVHDTPAAVIGAQPHKNLRERGTPLIEMRDISIAFGGIKAVDHATVDLYPGEVVGLLGHNGAGKSTLIKVLSGAYKRDAGQVFINGQEVNIDNPRDAKGARHRDDLPDARPCRQCRCRRQSLSGPRIENPLRHAR